MSQIFRSSSRS